MRGVWKQEHIRENIRVHMYKACVEPHLLYNIAPVPVTAAGAEELDREQRRLMRVALGIYYPNRIGNYAIYARMNSRPVSVIVVERRWKLMRKVLRNEGDEPAVSMMLAYYKDKSKRKKYLGASKTSIATIVQQESALGQEHGEYLGELSNTLRLRKYMKVAKEVDKWKEVVTSTVSVAQQQ